LPKKIGFQKKKRIAPSYLEKQKRRNIFMMHTYVYTYIHMCIIQDGMTHKQPKISKRVHPQPSIAHIYTYIYIFILYIYIYIFILYIYIYIYLKASRRRERERGRGRQKERKKERERHISS
jgi:hypothetical protein